MYLIFLLHDHSLICTFSVEKVVVAGYLITNGPFLVFSYWYFYAYSSPYALRLLCFALFPRLSPWQPRQLGTPTKVLPLFYPLGRFERIKTVLMGTNTPPTCIPGLFWQKKPVDFSQFELKVGELGFPIHFVCVSAALYHRGTRPPFFPLRWIRSILRCKQRAERVQVQKQGKIVRCEWAARWFIPEGSARKSGVRIEYGVRLTVGEIEKQGRTDMHSPLDSIPHTFGRMHAPVHRRTCYPAHMHAHTFPRPVDSSANLLLLFMSISSCCYFNVFSSVCKKFWPWRPVSRVKVIRVEVSQNVVHARTTGWMTSARPGKLRDFACNRVESKIEEPVLSSRSEKHLVLELWRSG